MPKETYAQPQFLNFLDKEEFKLELPEISPPCNNLNTTENQQIGLELQKQEEDHDKQFNDGFFKLVSEPAFNDDMNFLELPNVSRSADEANFENKVDLEEESGSRSHFEEENYLRDTLEFILDNDQRDQEETFSIKIDMKRRRK